MASIDILFPFILSFEGGFVNDPDDLGGATNKGVTLNTYRQYAKQCGQPEPSVEDLKKIPDFVVKDIMKKNYWDKWKANQIKSQGVANALVDWLWHSGAASIKTVQTLMKVAADGIVGPKTIAAINDRDAQALFSSVQIERKSYLERICEKRPTNRKYLNGWLRRVNSIAFHSLTLNKYEVMNGVKQPVVITF